MPTPRTLVAGEIASAPSGATVAVVIPAIDREQRFSDCPYMPRGTTDPAPGDACLVAFDDQAAAWVVAWTPS